MTVVAGQVVKVHNYEVNFFLHNFTVQYVNKSIVNVKVLVNKNLFMFLVLKTTQCLSRNGQDTGTIFIVQFHPVTYCCGQN